MPDRNVYVLACRVALAAALLTALGSCKGRDQETRLLTSVREERVAPPLARPRQELVAAQAAFIEVAKAGMPSVVNIATARTSPARPIDPFFRDFFGDLFPPEFQQRRKEQSLGSGFILTADGYIVTNAHVVSGADEIRVKLSDDQVYAGEVVGVDSRTDIAVLKIAARELLTPAVLGDSDKLQVGQWALAIGNPFGLDRTVTVGVVSAIGRANVGIEDYEDFIQTDASINPGNSGGPLLNIHGEVIGINTAIVAAGQGIGFAIPVNLARLISTQLIEQGTVTRGWLGVSIQPLTPELARSFGLDRPTGALVNQILEGSPAAKAGLQRGDVLLTFNGKAVRGVRELQLLVASTPVGHSVPTEILRDNRKMTLRILIAAQEPGRKPTPDPNDAVQAFGLTLRGTADGAGVTITAIEPDSPAAAAGARPGDVILAVNQIEVTSPDALLQVLEQFERRQSVVFLIRRGTAYLYLAFPTN